LRGSHGEGRWTNNEVVLSATSDTSVSCCSYPRQIHSSAETGTINASEIAHFSRLSSQWWDEHGGFSFLHKMNPVRVQFIREKLLELSQDREGKKVPRSQVLEGLDVLDVGCGGGLLSEVGQSRLSSWFSNSRRSLTRFGDRTLGIDASESNITIAKLHASADPKLHQLSYVNTAAESLLESEKRCDVVFLRVDGSEHVDNPAFFLSTCAGLVKVSYPWSPGVVH
jgi:polyprenyldihydroxybenzoate methyltransferase/3-demethylubiquinol 3-O-methyltransferase